MMKSKIILENLNKLYPNATCELNYHKPYELLIATVLSAQCTDKRVNQVTAVLFTKYDIFSLAKASIKDIEDIIRPCGTFTRKAKYLKEIAQSLVKDYKGEVPNNREYLENLPGVGHKTCNVVLANIYGVPSIAVDTHVMRVSIRLKLAKPQDNVSTIEKKLMQKFPQSSWIKLHHQLVLFGRYNCKAKNPQCINCPFKDFCAYYTKISSS